MTRLVFPVDMRVFTLESIGLSAQYGSGATLQPSRELPPRTVAPRSWAPSDGEGLTRHPASLSRLSPPVVGGGPTRPRRSR